MSLADSYVAIKGQECETEITMKGLYNSYIYTVIYIYILCIEVSLHTLACSDHGALDHELICPKHN